MSVCESQHDERWRWGSRTLTPTYKSAYEGIIASQLPLLRISSG